MLIPTGSPTSEPAWFCQRRPGCKPQPPWHVVLGRAAPAAWVGLSPTPSRWDAHPGTAAAILCTDPSMQQRKEGATENRMLALLCAALWQTGYFILE